MQSIELFIIAVGLAMDATAVSISKGLALPRLRAAQATWIGLWFGFFQAAMPVLGFFVGTRFSEQIKAVDHWVAFVLLFIVGMNMIRESLHAPDATIVQEEGEEAEITSEDLGARTMLLLAIATSIDALAVGISFALLKVNILTAACIIGVVTFLLSFIGVYLGHTVGTRFKKSATLLGGAILIGIGIKILLEHLGILS